MNPRMLKVVLPDDDSTSSPAVAARISGAASDAAEQLGVLPVHGGVEPHAVQFLKWLGAGRAAHVRLVQIRLANGESLQCVEKVFRPALLTRLIYRAAFQAPFAYQWSEHAIRACFYRRRVFGAVADAMLPGVRVAEPLYARWDTESEAFVLGSEYIVGRGIVPAAPDSFGLRRWFASLCGRDSIFPPAPREEISELLSVMSKLEKLLRSCGLVGSGWQVCKRAMVSTANLLRTDSGYTVVDLESGIPAVLVPAYVWEGARIGSLPLFDDIDAKRLRFWLSRNCVDLRTRLGTQRFGTLESDVEQLIAETSAWKLSEPAICRNSWRWLGRSFREQHKARCLDVWRRRNIIDAESEAAIRPGRRIFTRLTYVLGLVPGAPGRLLQRLWANRPYREQAKQFATDLKYRREVVARFVERRTEEWRERGRIGTKLQFGQLNIAFIAHALLATFAPVGLHRWLADAEHRRNVLTRMMLICVSSRFQSEFGRHLIRSSIRSWERSQRLSASEAELLHRQLGSDDIDEYVRGFGLHFGLKLLLPLMAPLKFSGAAASLASGNPLYFLVLILLLPACRTAITLWRMAASKRPLGDYFDALLVGMLPVVGTLAYPVQMYSKQRELSAFLLRDRAGWLGRCLPIYGGKDSRIEIAAIRLVNLVLESLEIGLAGTAPLRRRVSRNATAPRHMPILQPTRWDALVDQQLRLLAEDGAEAEAPVVGLPAIESRAA